MSALPSPSTATLIALESAFDTPARNLTKSRGKNIHRYVSARECHRAIRVKKAIPLIPPREGAAFWEKGHPRNLAVGCQKLYGSNKKWKRKYGYHRRSLSETAMYRVKQLLGASLTLRNYNAQVGETYAMIKALNKLTGIGMPETQYVV